MSRGRYRARIVDAQLDEYLQGLPAVAIDGPKAVGKTATASRRARAMFRLDDLTHLALLEAEPGRLRGADRPVLIDEWQRYPSSWDVVRRAVDDGASPGSFMLTGSASPRAPQTHSGAGRIVSLRMRPLTIPERLGAEAPVSLGGLLAGGQAPIGGATVWGLEEYAEAIVAGGFPGMQEASTWVRAELLAGYVERIVDHDFPEAGHDVRNPAALRRWLVAFARATSTTASLEAIRDASAAGQADPPARSTTIWYRDTLERIWLADPVPAWSPPAGYGLRRLTTSPKHFLADPALATQLLDLDVDALLGGRDVGATGPLKGPVLGAFFESLAALSLKVFAQASGATVSHLRTKGGEREIDFIVHGRGRRVMAVEVKLTAVPDSHDVRHLLWLKERLGDDLNDMVLITTGREAYRRQDGIAVVPLALLGP